MRSSPPAPTHSRPAFTLVEILVVVGIIAALMGTVWVSLGSSLDLAKAQQNKALLNEVDAALQSRMEAFGRLSQESSLGRNTGGGWLDVSLRASNIANGTTALDFNQARLYVLHDVYRGLFPQRLEDLFGLDGTAGTLDDSPLLALFVERSTVFPSVANLASNLNDPSLANQNVELLALMLTTQYAVDAQPLSPDAISESIQDVDGDGLIEIVDNFGNPLAFYNAPTRLIRPAGQTLTGSGHFVNPITRSQAERAKLYDNTIVLFDATAGNNYQLNAYSSGGVATVQHPLNTSPLDRLRLLDGALTGTIGVTNYYGIAGSTTLQALDETAFWTRNTYFQPLVVARGDDGELGFVPPTSTDAIGMSGQVVAGTSGEARLGYINPAEIEAIGDNLTNRKRVLR